MKGMNYKSYEIWQYGMCKVATGYLESSCDKEEPYFLMMDY